MCVCVPLISSTLPPLPISSLLPTPVIKGKWLIYRSYNNNNKNNNESRADIPTKYANAIELQWMAIIIVVDANIVTGHQPNNI